MRLQSRLTERVIALRGNHEAVALEVIDGEADEELWRVKAARQRCAAMASRATDHGQRFFVHAESIRTSHSMRKAITI